MKNCPTCGRTYVDDAFTYCLDDGAVLTTAYDPQATLLIPDPRETNQQQTDILRTPPPHNHSHTSPQQATARATDPFNSSFNPVASPLPEKRDGKTKMIVGGVIALLTAGVLVLGFLLWRNSQSSTSEVAKTDADTHANNGVITNSNVDDHHIGEGDKPEVNQSPEWLEGVWEGTGYQHAPEMTWSIKFTAENNTYSIEYPSLRCGGEWTLVELDETRAKFKEKINRGNERCSNDGDILIEKSGEDQLTYKYTLPIIGEVATATLSKGAAH